MKNCRSLFQTAESSTKKEMSYVRILNETPHHFSSVTVCVRVRECESHSNTVDNDEDDLRECFEIEMCFRWQARQQNDNEKYK